MLKRLLFSIFFLISTFSVALGQTQVFQAQPGYINAIQAQLNNLQSQINGFLLPPAATAGQFVVENAAGTAYVAATISGDISASVSTPGLLTITSLSANPVTVKNINGNTVGGPYGINNLNWDGRIDPRTYGAVLTGVSSATGSMMASNTTFTDNNVTFTSGMNRIKIQNGKIPADWANTTGYVRNNEIAPRSGNAGSYIFIQTATSCTSAGSAPVWNQTPGTTVTDSGCSWINLGITSLSYTTTVTFVNSHQLTLGLAPDVTSTTTQYVVGTDSTTSVNNAIAAATWQNGPGIVYLPCGSTLFASTINVGSSGMTNAHGVEFAGCGWGSSMSTSNQLGDTIIYDGPGDTPMIQVDSSFGVRIHGLRLISNQWLPASAGIEFDNPAGAAVNEDSNAYDIWIGNRGNLPENDTVAQIEDGIAFTPTVNGVNNGPHNFWNIRIGGWTDWGIDIPLSQYIGESFENVQINGQGLNYEMGGIRIGGTAIVFNNTTLEQVGATGIDMLPTGSATFLGTHTELTSRLVVCDMNGAGVGFEGALNLTDTYFQLDANKTASDGKIIDCDQTAAGGIVAGAYAININGWQYAQSTSPFVGTPLFALGSTATNPNTYNFLINIAGANNIGYSELSASTNAVGNHATFCFNNDNAVSGRQNNCMDVQGVNTALTTAATALDEKTQPLLIDSGATLQNFTTAISGGSACTVKVAGGATCKYKVSMKDNNGETIPAAPGVLTCGSSATLGSQDNVIHFFAPGKGETEYCIYGDDCNGGSFDLLTSPPNAGADNCIPRASVDLVSTFRQVSIEDNHLTRTGTAPPTVDTTGELALGPASLKLGTAVATPGAAATAIIGQTGGAGPATATQHGWVAIHESDGSTAWVPDWK